MQKLLLPFFLVLCGLLILSLQLGFLFLLVALLPSAAAWFMDNTPPKAIFKTVLACNLAGTLPSMIFLLQLNEYIPLDMLSLMSDPYSWLVIYCGAAVGAALVFLCRFIARFIVTIVYDYKVMALQKMQRKLIDEWGERVSKPSRP